MSSGRPAGRPCTRSLAVLGFGVLRESTVVPEGPAESHAHEDLIADLALKVCELVEPLLCSFLVCLERASRVVKILAL